jgi:hypothetical protein
LYSVVVYLAYIFVVSKFIDKYIVSWIIIVFYTVLVKVDMSWKGVDERLVPQAGLFNVLES